MPPRIKIKTRTQFNKRAILSPAEKAKARSLFRSSAYIRTTASRSMRKKKKPSRPGQPPAAHSGELKRLMRFAVARDRLSAVIGPAIFFGAKGGGGIVPPTLEFGGSNKARGRIIAVNDIGRRRDGTFINRKRFVQLKGRVHIKARPYMAPAMQTADRKGVLLGVWKDSVKG